MTVLYIIVGIAALVILILLLRVKITVLYDKPALNDGVCSVFLGLGFVKIRLYPKKEKKIKLSDYSAKKYRRLLFEDNASSAAPHDEKPKKKSKNELLPEGIGEIFDITSEIIEVFKDHLRCEVLRLRINVATKDAAVTALTYSGVYSAAMFLLETVENNTKLCLRSPKDIQIAADFDNTDFSCDIGLSFSIRTVNILGAGKGVIKRLLPKLIMADSKKTNSK